MLEEAYYPIAERMARRGATRGMIVQRLRREKLPEHAIESISNKALAAAANKKRVQGFLIASGGALLLGLALLSTMIFRANLPIVIAMLGLITLGVGMVQLRQDAPKNN